MSERTSEQPGAPALRPGAASLTRGSASLALVGDVSVAADATEGGAFSGAPGRLLEQLLAAAGIDAADVFVTGLLERAPAGNREPRPSELAAGQQRVVAELAVVQPRVVCTVGSAATRALGRSRGDIAALHGRAVVETIGGHAVHLVALHHPASAVYTPGVSELLRHDIAALPELLARPRPEPPPVAPPAAATDEEPPPPPAGELRLF